MSHQRTRVLSVLFVAFVVVASAVAYLVLTQTVGTNDSCVGAPFLGSPHAGEQTTIVNVSVHGQFEFRFVRASIWVNGARVGELNPLFDGGLAGPMTFRDADGNKRLTSGDRFVVETSPENEYRIDLYFGNCSIPSSQTWTG
jgi:hypothetical protein